MLSVLETFLSIQGEGYHVGESVFFIRTQGCDIGCHWCDEPNSWELTGGEKLSYVELIKRLKKTNTKKIVFTGGEPLIHDLQEITARLRDLGYVLHLETSGAYPLTGTWDWITLSPKKNKPPLRSIYSLISELKVIIYNKHDFEWALEQKKHVKKSCLLYLQPEWSRMEIVKSSILDFICLYPEWKLSLQTHKILDIK